MMAFQRLPGKRMQTSCVFFMSIGGGNPPPHLEKLMHKEKRPALVNEIVTMCERYEFDGVDVDIENSLINEDYPDFVAELAAALQHRKIN
jgi:chitinase